ncbi:MAG: fasciclin domain-containing protein [Phycisphaerales bacterium]
MNRLTIVGIAVVAAVGGVAQAQCKSGMADAGWEASGSCETATIIPVAWHAPEKDIVDTAVGAGQFTILAKALKAAELIEALKGEGPFTVFAPTDEAFAKLPKGTVETLLKPENKDKLTAILTYHVVPGKVLAEKVVTLKNAGTLNGQRVDIKTKDDKVWVDGARVTATDIMASNGVIHVIDTVLMPESKNIVEVASENGSFGTLLAAAKAAGLVDTLTGQGPFTVFAPTDEAFAKLAPGTVEMLLKPENKEKLRQVLLYHVVSGRVYSDKAVELGEAATVQGQDVMIKKSREGVSINRSKVVAADVEASNGVIHVIDAVLMPQ